MIGDGELRMCTCGVMTGGIRDRRQGYPFHGVADSLEARIREIVRLANRRGYVEDRIVTEILALFAEERAK